MVTLERPAYYTADRYAEYCGLSTDEKAAIKANNADKFYEIDTAKEYRYNAASNEWIEQPADTAAVDTGLPPITSETSGHFLSNDGNATHWQAIASEDFIITLTEATPADGTYTADKTWVEIKAAYDAKMNIAVSLDSARLPLMNAQFAGNGDAGFTFGYTQVTADAQLITTRAINYAHRANDSSDVWTDVDQTGEYLKTAGGILEGNLSMGNNNITDVQELKVDGEYPLYLGNVIHTTGTNGVRITATTNNEAAVVATDSQSTYKPINVGNPTADAHAVTLGYLTQGLKDDTATKNHVNLVRNSGSTISLQNGVYLLTACDTVHKGLACCYVCGDVTSVATLAELTEWTVTKGTPANSLYIDNKSDTQGLDVYIIALGASSAI